MTGEAPTTLGSGLNTPFGIAMDAANIYFTSYWTNSVMRMPLAGGTVTSLTPTLSDSGATGIAVNATSIYWGASNSALNVTPLAGGAVTTLVSGEQDPMGVAVDASDVYWTDFYSGSVKKMPLAGGVVTTLVSGSTDYVAGIAVNANSIYYAARDANSVGSILRLAK